MQEFSLILTFQRYLYRLDPSPSTINPNERKMPPKKKKICFTKVAEMENEGE